MVKQQRKISYSAQMVKNVLLNSIGTMLPLVAAIFSIPLLVKGLGTERFGVLAISWMFVGYFNLFDLGMGRALVKMLAERIGTERRHEIVPLIWTSVLFLLVLGLLAFVFVALLASKLAISVLNIPVSLQVESLHAFYVLSLSLPLVISNTALRGILEAYQRFDMVNAVRVPLGLYTYLAPLAILSFSNSLVAVVSGLVIGRLIVWIFYVALCMRTVPELRNGIVVDRQKLRQVLSFGGWITVSNIVGPFMVYFDRFIIGVFVSLTAVTYYTTSYEVATKLWLITGAIMPVLFPAFSAHLANDRGKALLIFDKGMNYLCIVLFPLTFGVILFAYEGLDLWLDKEFATHSNLVLKFLIAGVFINSLAQVIFAMVQGYGRPDLTAKLHLLELPLYFGFMYWAIISFGIVGASIAWTVRVLVDYFLLSVVLSHLLPETKLFLKRIAWKLSLLCLILFCAFWATGIFLKVSFFAVVIICFMVLSWRFTLTREEKVFVCHILKFRVKTG